MLQSWQTFSVTEFLDQVNWANRQLVDQADQEFTFLPDTPWQTSTVEFFFQNISWSGIARRHSFLQDEAKELAWTLDLADFFSCFAWKEPRQSSNHNKPQKTAQTVQSIEPEEPQFTLNDLSNLF